MADNEKQGDQMTFEQAVARARNVTCGDREGLFTCHTVDPYVDAMVAAHGREVNDLKAEIAQLKALLHGLRKIAHGAPTESLHTPWISRGRLVFPDSEHADAGDIIATFEDVDGVSTCEAVCAVNAFVELRDHLDRHFHDKEAT